MTLLENAITELMHKYRVLGLSLAIIKDGGIDWARGFGVLNSKAQHLVQVQSLFQAASMSKPVTALAALRLVEDGIVDLDSDVNLYLRDWKIPHLKNCTVPVTLRHILSHSSGLSEHGFPGYPIPSPLPSILDVLNGVAPATNSPIEAQWCPGSQSEYSGGAFCVLQLMIQQLTESPFEVAIQNLVLDPLGMSNSTFTPPNLDDNSCEFASGHTSDGTVVAGEFRLYPELAAAGLWTIPSDLARFVIGIQDCYHGRLNSIISQPMAYEMLSPQGSIQLGNTDVGLGVMLDEEGEQSRFSHMGGNEGYRGILTGHVEKELGAVIMVNSEVTDILSAVLDEVAKVYEWTRYLA